MDIEQQIRDRAFEIWQSEGCPDGCAEDHWVRAEAEIQAPESTVQETTRTSKTPVRRSAKSAKKQLTP